MASLPSDLSRRELTLADKLRGIRWDLAALVTVIAGIGFAMLYSAANGSMHPWAARQMARYALAFVPMLAAALVDIRHWFRLSYWIYGVSLLLVVAVDVRGIVGMGAQRWIGLGVIQLQPSEVMKIALVMALKQPDLGTAVMLLITGAVVLYLAGVRLWVFGAGLVAAAAAAPLAWS